MIVNHKIDGVNSVDYAAAKPSYIVRLGGDGQGDYHISKMGISSGGRTFTVMNNSFIKGDVTKTNLKAVVGQEGHLWFAAGDAGLYHSADGGKTWVKLDGFNTVPVIGLGKAAPGTDYQALYTNAKYKGKRGIYRSDDKGANWICINDDAHQFGTADTAITGDPRIYGRVYLATNGRGIQYRDLE